MVRTRATAQTVDVHPRGRVAALYSFVRTNVDSLGWLWLRR